MINAITRFHFSMGPVQGFIGQARRTRDLWAGSFLLSWLTGQAIKSAINQGAEILIPRIVDDKGTCLDPTMKAIMRPPADEFAGPLVGTLVNHFRANVPESFEPEKCRDALLCKWHELAKAVFDEFIAKALSVDELEKYRERWDHQIPRPDSTQEYPFWEIMWVRGKNGDTHDRDWLDRRKTWRSKAPPADAAPADHCFMMPEFEELSGCIRAARQGDEQDAFWEKIRNQIVASVYDKRIDRIYVQTIELRPNERLCAIALVKRLFPLLPAGKLQKVLGWIPTPNDFPVATAYARLDAARALRNWPSTAFVSAVHWIERAAKNSPEAARKYAKQQLEALELPHQPAILQKAEQPQHHKISCLKPFCTDDEWNCADFVHLDGNLFFPRGIAAKRFARFPNRRTPSDADWKEAVEAADKARKAVENNFLELLKALEGAQKEEEGSDRGRNRRSYGEVQEGKLKEPSPFYAYLMMDGDRLGRLLGQDDACAPACAAKISEALGRFAAEALRILREHNGIPIYAGADDVAALLPVEDAIPAAIALRKCYTKYLSEVVEGPTISGGLVFADYQNPLGDVRTSAHRMLDDVAKEANGRDSLAIELLKSGGSAGNWVSAWECSLSLGHIAERLATDSNYQACRLLDIARSQTFVRTMARRLPYLLRERYSGYLDNPLAEPAFVELVELLVSEFRGSRDADIAGRSANEMERLAADLVFAMSRVGGPEQRGGWGALQIGGLVIARFLASDGLWERSAAA